MRLAAVGWPLGLGFLVLTLAGALQQIASSTRKQPEGAAAAAS
jgi:hypothetical protein